jgi:hypothetical protein
MPPDHVALDADGRPHGDGVPALRWRDGTAVHCWRGTVVPASLMVPVRQIILADIQSEPNAQFRRILIERYGTGRFMREAGALPVHQDRCGTLYFLHQEMDEPIAMVRVFNSTPRQDGGIDEHWLRVPPHIATARDAVAWTFGLAAADYYPAAES